MKRELIYVGEDYDLVAMLEAESQSYGWQWTLFETHAELLHHFHHKKPSLDKPTSALKLRPWLQTRFDRIVPIVLDIDFERSSAWCLRSSSRFVNPSGVASVPALSTTHSSGGWAHQECGRTVLGAQ